MHPDVNVVKPPSFARPAEEPAVRRLSFAALTLALTALCTGAPVGPAAAATDPTGSVNPFIGTSGGGGTFPGAAVPFGMVQFSPNTEHPEGGGYVYDSTSQLRGFGVNHISGPGCAAYGDVPQLPTTGGVTTVDIDAWKTGFAHSTESASPGAYGVTLAKYDVVAELTATARTAWARYTYPAVSQANVIVEPGADFLGASAVDISVVGDTTVEGSVSGFGYFNTCNEKSKNRYTLYFSMVFDRPFSAFRTGNGTAVTTGQRTASGTDAGVSLRFDARSDQTVISKTGISYVSLAGARSNLTSETGGYGFDFDRVRTAAHDAWRDLLGRVEVTGGTSTQRSIYYTALYHSLLHPNVFSDADGRYIGFDGAVHTVAAGRAQYTNFSMWDTYRAQQQVVDLVAPERVPDMASSLLNDYQQGGWVPKWPYANYYTNEMVGDPAANVLVDAYLKNLVYSEDRDAISTALTHNAVDLPRADTSPFEGRTGLAELLNGGYVPYQATGDYANAASVQLEYG